MNYFGTITGTITYVLGLFYITEYMITDEFLPRGVKKEYYVCKLHIL